MKILEERDLDGLRRQTLVYAALCSWSSAGLFEALADGTSRRAQALGVSVRGLEVTGQMLRGIGLVECSSEGWSLSAQGVDLQKKNALEIRGPEQFFSTLARVEDALVTGMPVRRTEIGVVDSDPQLTREFLEMLYRRSRESVVETANLLVPVLSPGDKVLDLGGGHGRYGEALQEHCGAEVTLLDLPVSIGSAKDRYGPAQHYIEGDFMQCDLGGPYDAALLSNVVHGLGPDQLRILLPRLAECLVPGGLLVLKDMFIDGGCSPGIAESFGMEMLLATAEGRSYSVPQIIDLVAAAGFGAPQCHPVIHCDFSLLMFRRSAL